VELQVGQTWLTKNGKNVKLIHLDASNSVYPFKGDNLFWYTQKGCIYTYPTYNPHDLAELLIDTDKAPKSDAAPNGSLVERVALTRMNPPLDEDDLKYARAAIREVAAAARDAGLTAAAKWLELGADK
jgi:hypothetical protein